MMKKLLLFFACLAFGFTMIAQNAGDYRSVVGNVAWENAASWEKFDGLSWLPSADYPVQGGAVITSTVTIQASSTVTYTQAFQIYVGNTGQPGSLNVEAGGTLVVNVSGLTSVNVANGSSMTIDGTMNCYETISNLGDITVNGTLNHRAP